MVEPPLVSIITPSYNQAGFLEQTVRSVLAQDYPNIEYFVIDGASTDGSVEIIKKYGQRIARWVSEPDAGQSDAINKGFRMARGEIVAWLNSDDLYFPDAVSTAVRRFQDDPALAVFYGDGVYLDSKGQFASYFTGVERYNAFRLCNCSDFIMQPTTFFRRDALGAIGYLDASLHYGMDWDLWCRFAKGGYRFHYERKPIAATRAYASTKTMAGGRERIRELRRVLRLRSTSLWPHALFGYCATEVAHVLNRGGTRLRTRLPLMALLFLLRAGDARNIVHAQLHGRQLYGVRRRGGRLLRRARIQFPVYRRVSTLYLKLRNVCRAVLRGPLTVEVSLAGSSQAEAGLGKYNQRTTVSLAVPPWVVESHLIDVGLRFSSANVFGTSAVLEKVFAV